MNKKLEDMTDAEIFEAMEKGEYVTEDGTQQEEEQTTETNQETPEEETETEETSKETEEIEETEETDQQTQEEPESFEITVNGQKHKLTKEELIQNAQKGFDYTRKTQMLSDERRDIEARKRELLQMHRMMNELKNNRQPARTEEEENDVIVDKDDVLRNVNPLIQQQNQEISRIKQSLVNQEIDRITIEAEKDMTPEEDAYAKELIDIWNNTTSAQEQQRVLSDVDSYKNLVYNIKEKARNLAKSNAKTSEPSQSAVQTPKATPKKKSIENFIEKPNPTSTGVKNSKNEEITPEKLSSMSQKEFEELLSKF